MRSLHLLAAATILAFAPSLDAQQLRQADARRPEPATAAALGLVLPGSAQVYTGRPLLGAAFLGAAGGALALGLLSERVTVECLSRPADGICPPDHVLDRTSERPHLDAALVGVAAVALLSALDGFHAARHLRLRTGAVAGASVGIEPDGVRITAVEITF